MKRSKAKSGKPVPAKKAGGKGKGTKPKGKAAVKTPAVDDVAATEAIEVQPVAEEVATGGDVPTTAAVEEQPAVEPIHDEAPNTAQTVAPTDEPGVEPETTPVVCPNCGGTEVDEDGDCAKCHERRYFGANRCSRNRQQWGR